MLKHSKYCTLATSLQYPGNHRGEFCMGSGTQICLWKQQGKTIKLIHQLDFLHSAFIWENRSINSGKLMEYILRYWFCYWYGSAGLIRCIEWWFEVCVCVLVGTGHRCPRFVPLQISLLLQSSLMWADGWMIAPPWRRMNGFDICHITLTHA